MMRKFPWQNFPDTIFLTGNLVFFIERPSIPVFKQADAPQMSLKEGQTPDLRVHQSS